MCTPELVEFEAIHISEGYGVGGGQRTQVVFLSALGVQSGWGWGTPDQLLLLQLELLNPPCPTGTMVKAIKFSSKHRSPDCRAAVLNLPNGVTLFI